MQVIIQLFGRTVRNTGYLAVALLLGGCFVVAPLSEPGSGKNLSDEKAQYVFTEATKLKLFGQYKQAINLFEKYIEKFPDSHASHYQLAQIYLSLGEMKKAEQYTSKAREIDPDNAWYDYFLISVYKMGGNVDALIALYEEMLQDKRDDEMIYELAMFHQRKGNHERSLQLLESLEENYGIAEEINIPKYENYLMLNQDDQAFKEINKLLRLYPERSEYYGILAEYYLSVDDLDSAKQHYDRLFMLDSASVMGRISYVDYLIKKKAYDEAFALSTHIVENPDISRRQKVEMLINLLSRNELLVQHQERVYELLRTYDTVHPHEASALTLYADYYIKIGARDKALDVLKKLVQIDRSNYLYWEQLILLENENNNTDSVIKYSNEALEIFPKVPNLYLINGISQYYKENYKAAAERLEKGYDINNSKQLEQQFIIFLAECYNKLKNYDRADKFFQQAIESYPENHIIKNNYAYYLSLREVNLDYALKLSGETLDKEPLNHTYLDTYAWILYKMGKYKEAYRYIEKAIKMGGSDSAEVLEHCGDILVELKQFKDATYMYERALELDDSNHEVKNKLERYGQSK